MVLPVVVANTTILEGSMDMLIHPPTATNSYQQLLAVFNLLGMVYAMIAIAIVGYFV